jgi:hypothetical protein
MNKSKLVFLTVAIFLGGCAVPTTIQLAKESKSGFEGAVYQGKSKIVGQDLSNNEQYRVFEQGDSGFVPIRAIRSIAEQRAKDFCSEKNKTMKAIKEQTSVHPHIIGNFPRIEITFVCADNQDVTTPSSFQDVLYIKLINLKKLLDDGVITKEEFEKEKAKILNQ